MAREPQLNRAGVILVGRPPPQGLTPQHVQGDLPTIEGITWVAEAIKKECPDILVNMAGAQYFGPFERQSPQDLHASFMVNLLAPVLLTQAALPAMKRRGAGQIVNIGSIFGLIHYPHFVTYSSGKAGLRGFSEALTRELRGWGIDVTYIASRAVRIDTNSALIVRFLQMAKMKLDAPEDVARRIVEALVARKREVFFGAPERMFVAVNALIPHIKYQLSDQDEQLKAIDALSKEAAAVVQRYPGQVKPLLWDGIITSEEAKMTGLIHKLRLAVAARKLFEQAEAIGGPGPDGAVAMSLGVIYYRVPVMGFGDVDKARR